MITEADEIFMNRAFDLALKGMGKVAPNPMVGCVIVHQDQIIGEGHHELYGGPHAEPNAIKSVKEKELLEESTIYVSLEPCSHYGKTPPCADLISEIKPKRVVIANVDPNPLVAGEGVKKMESADIQVDTGCLGTKGEEINKRFFTFMRKQRPYVLLKWAQTADGFIAKANHDSKWISNESSRKLVHLWRAEESAIMVGTKTAQYDNPKLNVRLTEGKSPIRIVIDKKLSLSEHLNLFDHSQATLVFNEVKNEVSENLEFVKVEEANSYLKAILDSLYERKILSVIVEGGTQLLQSFIDLGLWDEARVFTSSITFSEGIQAPDLKILPKESQDINGDILNLYTNG